MNLKLQTLKTVITITMNNPLNKLYSQHKRNILSVFLFFNFIPFSSAQMIENPAFRLLLSGMLSHSVPEISVQEADSLKKLNAIFIDTREEKEFLTSHIEGSIFVGYDSLDLSSVKKIEKSKEIVVYCSVGYRSEKIAERLVEMGYINVKNLYGGIFEWKNQNKHVVNPANEVTEKVHAYNRVWGVWLQKGVKVY